MLTSTGTIFHIIVYHYTEFVTLEFDMIVSETDCKTLTLGLQLQRNINQAGMNNSSPHSFVVASLLPTFGSCFRIQVIQRATQYYHFLFDTNLPASVTFHRLDLGPVSNYYVGASLTPIYIDHSYTYCPLTVDIYSESYFWHRRCNSLHKQLTVNYISKRWYIHIDIILMPCEVPCSLLGYGKIAYDVETCDICKNVYVFHQRLVYFKSNSLLKSQRLCNECMQPGLRLSFFVLPIPYLVFQAISGRPGN